VGLAAAFLALGAAPLVVFAFGVAAVFLVVDLVVFLGEAEAGGDADAGAGAGAGDAEAEAEAEADMFSGLGC
jgi:hypothetical protein